MSSNQADLVRGRIQACERAIQVQHEEIESSGLKDDLRGQLLHRWREQVFQLLVQNKTEGLLHKQQVTTAAQKLQGLEVEVKKLRQHIETLTIELLQKSSVMEHHKQHAQVLEDLLRKSEAKSQLLSARIQQQHELVMQLFQSLQNMTSIQERKFDEISCKLDTMNTYKEKMQQMTKMLTIQIPASLQQRKLHHEQTMTELSQENSVLRLQLTQHQQDQTSKQHTIDILTQETNQLQQQFQDLNMKRQATEDDGQQQMMQLQQTYSEELQRMEQYVSELKGKLEQQESQLDQKQQEEILLQSQLEELNKVGFFEKQTIQNLKMELEEQQKQAAKDKTKAVKQAIEETKKKIQDFSVEHAILKKKHMKAVLNLKRMTKEIEASQSMRLQQQHTRQIELERQLHSKNAQVKSLQNERDTLLSTVRQLERMASLSTLSTMQRQARSQHNSFATSSLVHSSSPPQAPLFQQPSQPPSHQSYTSPSAPYLQHDSKKASPLTSMAQEEKELLNNSLLTGKTVDVELLDELELLTQALLSD